MSHLPPFAIVPSIAVLDKNLGNAAIRTLLCLSALANQNRMTVPVRLNTLAAKLGKSKRSVRMDMKQLIDAGYVIAHRRYKDGFEVSSQYEIRFDQPAIGEEAELPPREEAELPPREEAELPPREEAELPPNIRNSFQEKEKDGFTRDGFLRQIGKGFEDGEFNDWPHLTETEVREAAKACLDHWAGKDGGYPTGDPVAAVRNWIRGGIRNGVIRKQGDAAKTNGGGRKGNAGLKERDATLWRVRCENYRDKGQWLENLFGPPPDQPDTKVPQSIIKDVWPDGRIPTTA